MTKWSVQKQTHRKTQKHVEHQDATDIQKKYYIFGFYLLYFLLFIKWFLQEMLSYILGTANDFYWGFKPVWSYSKPHTFSTIFGEENVKQFVIRWQKCMFYYSCFWTAYKAFCYMTIPIKQIRKFK